MRVFILLLLLSLTAASVAAVEAGAETVPSAEDDAGAVGPENGFLYAFDIVGDNIQAFLARIGGEESWANSVRRNVAERRAEHLRLLRLKAEGEIDAKEFSSKVSKLNTRIQRDEEKLRGKERAAANTQGASENPGPPA